MFKVVAGESKTYRLTFRNKLTRALLDVSSAAISFYLRATRDGANLVTITDTEMDTSNASDGYVYLTLTATHTGTADGYLYGMSLLSLTTQGTDEKFFNFYIESA